MDVSPTGIDDAIAALTRAMQPLIDFRRTFGVDVDELAQDETHPLTWDVAVALDAAFDALDSAMRSLEDPEAYLPEPTLTVESTTVADDVEAWLVRGPDGEVAFVTLDKDRAERFAADGIEPEPTASPTPPRVAAAIAADDDEVVIRQPPKRRT